MIKKVKLTLSETSQTLFLERNLELSLSRDLLEKMEEVVALSNDFELDEVRIKKGVEAKLKECLDPRIIIHNGEFVCQMFHNRYKISVSTAIQKVSELREIWEES